MSWFVALTLALTVKGTFNQAVEQSVTTAVSFRGNSSESAPDHPSFNIVEQPWYLLPDEERNNVVRFRTMATVTDLKKRVYSVTCSTLGTIERTSGNGSAPGEYCTEMIVVGEFQDDGNNHVLDFVLLNGSHAIKSDEIVNRQEIRNDLARTLRLDWVDISKAEFPSPLSTKTYSFIAIILVVALIAALVSSLEAFRRRRRTRATRSLTPGGGDPQVMEIGFVDLPIHTPERTFDLRTDNRQQHPFIERL